MIYINVTTAYIEKGGGVLLLRRSAKNKHFVGYWQLPEGKIEKDETPLEAIQREVLEETASHLSGDVRYCGEISTNTILREEKVCVKRYIFRDNITSFDSITLSDEHQSYDWVDLNTMDEGKYILYPGTQEVVDLVREGNKNE